MTQDSERGSAWEVLRVFTHLGVIGFGGPAAHTALMREELVRRRGWVDEREFLDLVGACNLVPGPNSTELAIHLGLKRAGWRGFVAAACGFILPAMTIVLVLAVLYERYGTSPTVVDLSYGVLPVVAAIVANAIVGLGRSAVRDVRLGLIAVASFVAFLFGVGEVPILAGAALLAAVPLRRAAMYALLPAVVGPVSEQPTLWRLTLMFLKVGAILYGSGYVLISFLQQDLVHDLGWLTETQLLDAVAVGQVTPGPVFTTATFVGYQILGFWGAVLATLAIFTPAFVFVGLLNKIVPLMRRSAWVASALDGVVVASLGLMAGALVRIGDTAFVDPLTWLIGLAALAVLLWKRPNPTWLIAAGAAIGLAHGALT